MKREIMGDGDTKVSLVKLREKEKNRYWAEKCGERAWVETRWRRLEVFGLT